MAGAPVGRGHRWMFGDRTAQGGVDRSAGGLRRGAGGEDLLGCCFRRAFGRQRNRGCTARSAGCEGRMADSGRSRRAAGGHGLAGAWAGRGDSLAGVASAYRADAPDPGALRAAGMPDFGGSGVLLVFLGLDPRTATNTGGDGGPRVKPEDDRGRGHDPTPPPVPVHQPAVGPTADRHRRTPAPHARCPGPLRLDNRSRNSK